MVILAGTKNELTGAIRNIQETAVKVGLKVNCNRTKSMEMGTLWRRERNDKIVLDDERDLEKMEILRMD